MQKKDRGGKTPLAVASAPWLAADLAPVPVTTKMHFRNDAKKHFWREKCIFEERKTFWQRNSAFYCFAYRLPKRGDGVQVLEEHDGMRAAAGAVREAVYLTLGWIGGKWVWVTLAFEG